VQPKSGKQSRKRTALKRCTNTENRRNGKLISRTFLLFKPQRSLPLYMPRWWLSLRRRNQSRG